ncbi:MAG: hypothetical protein ACAI35_21485 [Candidatus Methylacidiphilales bacterium]|nr:hypothetical protein [Candidatus Methylacidiphilales bacterium]
MKVLFTALYPMFMYHLVVELEIMQKHLDLGDEITIAGCNAALRTCECNKAGQLHHCLRCIGLRQDGLSLLKGNYKTIQWPEEAPVLPHDLKTTFRNSHELRNYKYKDYDMGAALFASLVETTRDVDVNPAEHPKVMKALLHDAYKAYSFAEKELAENHYDVVYVFNGKYATARPWLYHSQKRGVTYRTHERTSGLHTYYVFENTMPHEPTQYAGLIREYWKEHHQDPHIRAEAIEFFEERPKGLLTGWTSFTKDQQAELLPAGWCETKRNIAVFASSEGEFNGLPGIFLPRIFSTQIEGLLRIARDMLSTPEFHLYVRIHPNSLNEKRKWWEDAELVQLSNITIVAPDSKVSSYALLKAAEKTMVFSSTMGIEATYYGKPCILANECYYRGMDAVYEPETPQEIVQLLKSDLQPKDKEKAIAYGAYWRCGGHPLRYSEAVNYYTLSFRGKLINARPEVYDWYNKCQARPAAGTLYKIWQDWQDKRKFREVFNACDGWLAETPRPHNLKDEKCASCQQHAEAHS